MKTHRITLAFLPVLIFSFPHFGFAELNAQDYTVKNGNIVTEITFYSPDIVRVQKYQASDEQGKSDPKVVVTMTPQEAHPTILNGNNTDTLLTQHLKVTCNKKTGILAFYRPDGTTLIRERAKANGKGGAK